MEFQSNNYETFALNSYEADSFIAMKSQPTDFVSLNMDIASLKACADAFMLCSISSAFDLQLLEND